MKNRTRIVAEIALLALLWTTQASAGGTEGLPPGAPDAGTVITVDVSTNTAYLFRDGTLIRKSKVATGMNKVFISGESVWLFRTPRGRHIVLNKIKDPVWTKPDWAFAEEGKPVPPPNSPERLQRGKLGRYALDLGDGILLHGTDDPASIGRRVTHGCVRLPEKMLELLYREAEVGTPVYIFDSHPEDTSRWRAELQAALNPMGNAASRGGGD